MLASYRPYDYVAINDSLPKVYRLDGISDNGFRQCDDKAVDYLPDCPSHAAKVLHFNTSSTSHLIEPLVVCVYVQNQKR